MRYRAEMDMRRKDGSSFPAEISVASISAQRTWVDGVISVIRDITRRTRDGRVVRRHTASGVSRRPQRRRRGDACP
ncbi:MAG: PAS domain S-box protein [Spirochaetaceae bacterium]